MGALLYFLNLAQGFSPFVLQMTVACFKFNCLRVVLSTLGPGFTASGVGEVSVPQQPPSQGRRETLGTRSVGKSYEVIILAQF